MKQPRESGGGERHLLIAVDGSENAKHAVLYIADFLGGFPGFRVTLLHVVTEPMQDYFPAEDDRIAWVRKKQASGEETLGKYRHVLLASGFDPGKVDSLVVLNRELSVAECILREQQRLKCCTVVMGRRGISSKEEFIFGSTSSKILHARKNCAVWVIE